MTIKPLIVSSFFYIPIVSNMFMYYLTAEYE